MYNKELDELAPFSFSVKKQSGVCRVVRVFEFENAFRWSERCKE